MAETTLPKLLVSREEAYQKIQVQIEKGQQLRDQRLDYRLDSYEELEEARTESKKWSRYNEILFTRLFDKTSITENDYINFAELKPRDQVRGGGRFPPSFAAYVGSYRKGMGSSINSLEQIRACLELYDEPSEAPQRTSSNEEVSDMVQPTFGEEVFIVHGRDEEAKVTVARFVEHLGIEAIILDEQVNEGQTIPEKFEEHANRVGFAIILLTPDDVGASRNERENLKPRARQNVVLELGYFWGKLGRKRLCVLYKEGVELPSDIRGIVYVPMDDFDGWKQKLAKEMNRVKLPIDPTKLL
ncbi:DNA-binding protein [Candidatus Poribacteria bacterium]|nr:DNA-binding protein [Candidatus Poribacteria bacterium]